MVISIDRQNLVRNQSQYWFREFTQQFRQNTRIQALAGDQQRRREFRTEVFQLACITLRHTLVITDDMLRLVFRDLILEFNRLINEAFNEIDFDIREIDLQIRQQTPSVINGQPTPVLPFRLICD